VWLTGLLKARFSSYSRSGNSIIERTKATNAKTKCPVFHHSSRIAITSILAAALFARKIKEYGCG
jgi:hypothetical protein